MSSFTITGQHTPSSTSKHGHAHAHHHQQQDNITHVPPPAGNIEDLENPFTHFYGQLLHQANMLQDSVRTGCYQQAILQNPTDFYGKTVLDVGTGSGILSFFAAQAGARKVYAVEASKCAEIARQLAIHNGFGEVVEVIEGKLETINLPEKVDVIISEPIGFLLVHERMLETYVTARDKFLKPNGLMFPTTGSIVFAPITDEQLYKETLLKAAFWEKTDFYGIDITPALARAKREHLSQPVVGYFPSSMIISPMRTVHTFDFSHVSCDELKNFEINFSFEFDQAAVMHGFGCWFDFSFLGSDSQHVLSTSPDRPCTHWYQCRLLLTEPIGVNPGQQITGKLKFIANEKFSYTIQIFVSLVGTNITSGNIINLQDQVYSYLHTPSYQTY